MNAVPAVLNTRSQPCCAPLDTNGEVGKVQYLQMVRRGDHSRPPSRARKQSVGVVIAQITSKDAGSKCCTFSAQTKSSRIRTHRRRGLWTGNQATRRSRCC